LDFVTLKHQTRLKQRSKGATTCLEKIMELHEMRARSLVSPEDLEDSLQKRTAIRIIMQESGAEFDFKPLEKSTDDDGFEVYSGIAKLKSARIYSGYSRLSGNLKFVAQLATRDGEVACVTYLLSAEWGQARKWTRDEYDTFIETLTSRRSNFAKGLIGVYEKEDRYIAAYLHEPLILPGMEGVSCELAFYGNKNRTSDDLSKLYGRARKLVEHITQRDGVRRVGVQPTAIRVSFDEGDENCVLEDIESIYFQNYEVEIFTCKRREGWR